MFFVFLGIIVKSYIEERGKALPPNNNVSNSNTNKKLYREAVKFHVLKKQIQKRKKLHKTELILARYNSANCVIMTTKITIKLYVIIQ